jgi:hypothetical protein
LNPSQTHGAVTEKLNCCLKNRPEIILKAPQTEKRPEKDLLEPAFCVPAMRVQTEHLHVVAHV